MPKGRFYFFLEADRGTMTVKRFTLRLPDGELILSGYRYDGKTGQLYPPSFIGSRKGRPATVKAEGEIAQRMQNEARELHAEFVKYCQEEEDPSSEEQDRI